MPMFSVIMATHSRPTFLEEAIGSVLNQSFCDWELIVVDDNGEIPASVPDDPRIKLIRNATNLGPAGSRNRGLREATGYYVAILDDDDMFAENRLANALEAHKLAPDMALCGETILGARRFSGSTDVTIREWPQSWILNGTAPTMCRLTIRRSICPDFNESYPASADLDWWIRATYGVSGIGWFTSPDWIWRQHDGPRGIIGPSSRIEASRQLLQEHEAFFRRNPTARAFRLRRIGHMSLQLGRRREALLAASHSMAIRPRLGTAKLLSRTLWAFIRPPALRPSRTERPSPEQDALARRAEKTCAHNGTMLHGTVYSDQLDQAYVRTMADLVTRRAPNLQFVPWNALGLRVMLGPRPAVIQVQWFDVILRRRRTRQAILGALRMVLFLGLLRLGQIPSLVIFHNPMVKGHSRVLLDRLLRTALVLVGSSFVVLNKGAADIVHTELYSFARKRFKSRVVVVPHPRRIVKHGERRSTSDARARLGLETDGRLVVYLPGANQKDSASHLVDPEKRYTLLRLDRSRTPLRFTVERGEIIARGRPDDEQFGLMICAADALVLTDPTAFGSATLHAAVDLERPVIGPRCPATEELFKCGGGVATQRVPTPDEIAAALSRLDVADFGPALETFRQKHSDEVVARAATHALVQTGGLICR